MAVAVTATVAVAVTATVAVAVTATVAVAVAVTATVAVAMTAAVAVAVAVTANVKKIPRRNHITPVLKNLHWSLRIIEKIEFKILRLTHRAFYETGPIYT